jgi:hypothetical protein
MVAHNPLNSPPVGTRDQLNWQLASLSDYGDKDDPSIPDPAYWQQAMTWQPVRACLEGTSYLRLNAAQYLPQQPMELDDSWRGRVSRSVFTPLFQRVVRTAVGLIMRKPIMLDGDPFWTETFAADVDRMNSGLDEFVRNQLFLSIAFGHSSWLVDFPTGEGIRTLRDQQEAQLRPYFVPVDGFQVLGFRQDARKDAGKLQQVRIKEVVSIPKGRFGTEVKERIRVVEPTRWEIWERQDDGPVTWIKIEEGPIAIGEIPLVTTYSGKVGTLFSKPPMLELAHLNLAYFQRHSDLIQALHVAAQPIMVMAGYDPSPDDKVGLSVNNAICTGPRGESEIYYVEPSVSSFDSQRAELEGLADSIRSLGLAILTEEKSGVESAKAKALDRLDSNSILSVISKDLEKTLQQAFDLAGQYMGIEPPVVSLDRDFDVEPIDGQMMTAINTLYQGGLLDQETALRILDRGELFDDTIEVEDILDRAEIEAEAKLEQDMARLESETQIAQANAPVKPAPKG